LEEPFLPLSDSKDGAVEQALARVSAVLSELPAPRRCQVSTLAELLPPDDALP
jgi:hypothetical protein